MARATLRRRADHPLVCYFEAGITGRQLDEASSSLACALAARGFASGDRLVTHLQNSPQVVIALLATLKLGGILVPTNPMYRSRELRHILDDSEPCALMTSDDLWLEVGRSAAEGSSVRHVITTSPLDFLNGTVPPRLLAGLQRRSAEGTEDLVALIKSYAGGEVATPIVAGDDPAALIYTSGTTGPPKGAIITHRNLIADAVLWRTWLDLDESDILMGVAPLFHITGLAAGAALSLLAGAPLVLAHRFDAATTIDLIERHRTTFIVGAITVFTAIMNDPTFRRERLQSLRLTLSGGAPVAPAMVTRWREAAGTYIQNCYGLTETTSLTHLVPVGQEAPVDPGSGALSIGIPVSGIDVEVHDDAGRPLPPGEIGEIVIGGPPVTPGYWRKPEETATALPDGRLRTGDVGFMDEQGWFYLVDRRKDLIVASGYKVWPREVEDVLLEHPAVREAAVVGAPDAYRGETVHAFISLRPGHATEPAELIGFCRERMAAYKYPRAITMLEELPKTATGKILRRELREGITPDASSD